MKIDAVTAMNKLNPIFFYLGFILHNYAIKCTNRNYLFVFTFFPSMVYVLVKCFLLGIEDLFNFKSLFYGLLLGILDFTIVYIYSEIMRTNSTFLCITISIFPALATLLPMASYQFLCTFFSIFISTISLRTLANYEIFGRKKLIIMAPLGGVFIKGDTVILFIFLLIFRAMIGWVCYRRPRNGEALFAANMFYLGAISLVYRTCIENVGTFYEGPNLAIVFSCYFYVLFLLTLSSAGKQKHIHYFLMFCLINLFYFLKMNFVGFKTTRTEMGLWLTYILIFFWLYVIIMHAVFWYFYKYKNLYFDYQNYRQSTIRELLINLEQESLSELNELIVNQH